MRFITGWTALLLLLGWAFGAAGAHAYHEGPCREYGLNILAENDLFGGGSDRHFTHGSRVSLVEYEPKDLQEPVPEDCSEKSLVMRPFRFLFEHARNLADNSFGKWFEVEVDQVSLILGQSIFTPEDTDTRALVLDDRPYAGWLYVGIGLLAERDPVGPIRVFDSFEIDVGMIGPQSYADNTQIEWHEVVGVKRPQGWDHQLKNEPGFLFNYERKWVVPLPFFPKESVLQLDVLPSLGVALGNVFTYGSLGAMFRLGHDLPMDYGPPRIRPGAQGSDFFKTHDGGFSWYVFAGVEGRAVAQNIFLDGNTFAESHSVDKTTGVGDFHMGLVMAWDKVRLAVTQVFRSKEFEGQKEQSEFGALSLSVAW